ncbi:MAG: GNAT family N-acetyltransferase [Desulfobacteraceae bacterium]|nr:GNAT family N-acetyltransferase [Desulfobacteraceae bacterium]
MNSPIEISTDKNQLDIDYIHNFLANSYWAKDIPKKTVEKSIENSFCFGIYKAEKQVGFARVVTDFISFGYLADVFVDESQRGAGLGKQLVQSIVAHDKLKDLKRWHLLTDDAQSLYKKFGFVNPEKPLNHMEKRKKIKY